ncbi:MAG: hypothetical protein L0229_30785 [Blastocatellia bacterium]|nr:hypothetical protein [Blastocatellia bacterium]
MKSVFACLFPALFLIPAAQAQQERDKFIGRAHSIRTELIYLDTDPGERGGKRHLSALRTFDPNGNLTMYEDFYAFGGLSYGKDTYAYDANGNMIEKAHEINGSTYKTTYTYNGKGQIIEEKYIGQIREYIYDSEDRLIEIKQYYNEGLDDGKTVISYDDKGRLIGRTRYKANGSFDGKETRAYNDEGNLVSEVNIYRTKTYNAKGQLVSEVDNRNSDDPDYRKKVYEYDSKGHLAKEEVYGREGLKEKFVYEYEFDSVGNWVKQVTSHWDAEGKKRVWETYRIITYY